MRLLPSISAAHSAVAISTTAPRTTHNLSFAEEAISAPLKNARYPTLTGTHLPKAQTDALAADLNALYKEVMDSLGTNDARYIQRVYSAVVYSELVARGLLVAAGRMTSWQRSAATWLLATSLLSFSKILNNMELGHNVMHGQFDWMQHPHLNSKKFDWDIVCPAPLWQHSHNYLHHTFTNIVGRDHDVGYHLIRVTDEQPWIPDDRYNMLKTLVLALGFEWAVAFHDIQISAEDYADSPEFEQIMQAKSQALFTKIARQVGKDYLALPIATGLLFGKRSAMSTLSGNFVANITRNVWTWAVIFCGHFTEQAHIYTQLAEDESKGEWYVRQILGSSNIEGKKWFHILTGNLSHQIEHHIFPDMPANHYARIAPQVQAICQKYGLSYNTGRFGDQLKQVIGRIRHFSHPSEAEWLAYSHKPTDPKTEEAPKSVVAVAVHYLSFSKLLDNYLPPMLRCLQQR
ncbi:fatty acid desaturase family protein [Psychrobacter sp. 1U2]|uniref:fatty acid desaturase family protein n=1 Tax=Psychrobacter sp. 1U2 TaxID=3453577 RepID=UPI003F469D12